MPYCPKCKIEYRDGYLNCPDCGEPLVEKPVKKEDTYEIDPGEPCLLTTVYKKNEAAMFGALLNDSGIPYFIKYKGMGSYLKLYMGFTVFGEEIYVNENQYDKAKELWDLYFSNNEDTSYEELKFSEDREENKEELDEPSTSFVLTRKRAVIWVARIILCTGLISILYTLCMTMIDLFRWFNK